MSNIGRADLSSRCYDVASIRKIEEVAFQSINENKLMERAGTGVFSLITKYYSKGSILVFCGYGNNGGDGYVVARLAHEKGYLVSLVYLCDPEKLPTAAFSAYKKCKDAGVNIEKFNKSNLYQADIIIDGLIGIGLSRGIEKGELFDAINIINNANAKVISIDVPSGLNSNTGTVMGIAVRADSTITFIAKKIGLLTNDAKDYVGKLSLDTLDISDEILSKVEHCAILLHKSEIPKYLCPRKSNTHKGNYGHVLIVGGDDGMGGAVIMSAFAAFRAGAGKVSIVTHHNHSESLFKELPEVMIHKYDESFNEYIESSDAVVLGPGMGQTKWSSQVWESFVSTKPLVLDAGGLRLMAHSPKNNLNCILTPHPGEAASLLDTDVSKVQKHRYEAARKIASTYKSAVVLKGSGTIICDPDSKFIVSPYGNPGMASAGMGDILSGILGALLANKHSNLSAATLGVLIHSLAGDLAAGENPIGLMAMDTMKYIRSLVNIK